MTNPINPELREQLIKSFEENLLDGDKTQSGQILASTIFKEWLEDIAMDLVAKAITEAHLEGQTQAIGDLCVTLQTNPDISIKELMAMAIQRMKKLRAELTTKKEAQ